MCVCLLAHLFDGSGTSSDLNKIGSNEGLTELVEHNGELELEFFAVLVGTVHGVTTGQALSGGTLIVGVVDGRSQSELVEVLEEVVLAFFVVIRDVVGLGQNLLGMRDEHLVHLECVVGNKLVEDKHDTIVVHLSDQLGAAGEIVEVGHLAGVRRREHTRVKSRLLFQGLLSAFA